MQIGVLAETNPLEPRVAASQESVKRLTSAGCSVMVEQGFADHLHWTAEGFVNAGATTGSREQVLADSDILFAVDKPHEDDIAKMKAGAKWISFLDPFNERQLIEQLANQQVEALSVEMLPRSTRAQKMDALSSQHSLAGYYMVVHAADLLGKALPMMTTPSGTIQPARVLVIGAGVAGLQAIATARRLGARVEAFDTRPVVAEQVRSLGARFIEIDLGETGQTEQGYAKELTTEQQALQKEGMAKACSQADIVITTAKLFGRSAPQVIDDNMLKDMKAGSLVVDYAVSSGGNVAGSIAGEVVVQHGVKIVGMHNYPGEVALDSSRMYANNLMHFVLEFWNKETSLFEAEDDDEIISGATLTRCGEIIHPVIRKQYQLPELSEIPSSSANNADNEPELQELQELKEASQESSQGQIADQTEKTPTEQAGKAS